MLGFWLSLAVAGVAIAVAAQLPAVVLAQGAGSTEYLIRLLHDSDAFRVRARAADALGSRATEPAVIPALTAALSDDNAAVRAAAAASLGRVGDGSALAGLRALDRDPEAAVRTAARAAIAAIEGRSSGGGGGGGGGGSGGGGGGSGTPRYYVGVALAGTSVSAAVRQRALDRLRSTVGGMAGVVLAPDGEASAAATRVLRTRSLTGFFLDASVQTVQDTTGGVQVVVGVILQDYPGRNMRAMLSGRATVTGVHDVTSPAVADAIAAALNGAVRRLPETMAATRGGGSR